MKPAPLLRQARQSLWLDSFAELRHPEAPTARCSLASGRRGWSWRQTQRPGYHQHQARATLLAYADQGDPVEFMQHDYAAAQGRIAVKTDDLIT